MRIGEDRELEWKVDSKVPRKVGVFQFYEIYVTDDEENGDETL